MSTDASGRAPQDRPVRPNPLSRLSGMLLLTLEILLLFVRVWGQIFYSIFLIFFPPAEKSVAGEVVLITGTGHGIGRELALKFAGLGANVVCVDINEQGNAETVKMIAKLGATKAVAYKCDVSNRDAVQALATKVRQEVGPVTVLVNNAGIMPTHSLLKHNHQEIRRIFDVNVMAHFWLLECFLPGMLERKHGHIVATASMCGMVGMTNLAPYCASKFAVRGLMESLAVEQAELNPDLMECVRYTTVCPSWVGTGLVKGQKVRFPSLFNMLDPVFVADSIVTAMRRNEHEVTIPSWLMSFNTVLRMLPNQVQLYVRDFMACTVLPGEKE